jgi:hypothetical protein
MVASTESYLPDLAGVLDGLEEELPRWGRKASRGGLGQWQHRKIPPGLLARTYPMAAGYYGWPAYRNCFIHGKRPYYRTGATYRMLQRKRPRVSHEKGKFQVVAKLSLGGGALNFLGKVRGITRLDRVESVEEVHYGGTYVSPYLRATRSGRVVRVAGYVRPAYSAMKRTVRYEKAYDSRTLLQRWADTSRDEPAIAKWIHEHMVNILKNLEVKRVSKAKIALVSRYLEGIGHG